MAASYDHITILQSSGTLVTSDDQLSEETSDSGRGSGNGETSRSGNLGETSRSGNGRGSGNLGETSSNSRHLKSETLSSYENYKSDQQQTGMN